MSFREYFVKITQIERDYYSYHFVLIKFRRQKNRKKIICFFLCAHAHTQIWLYTDPGRVYAIDAVQA